MKFTDYLSLLRLEEVLWTRDHAEIRSLFDRCFLSSPGTVTAEARKSIQAKVIELLETSNFNSKDHPGDIFRGGLRRVHRKYRTTLGGQYLVVCFPEPRQFDLIRGQATAIEVVVGLNHPEYADALFTIDAEGRVVEHSKFSGKDATELLKLVKSERNGG